MMATTRFVPTPRPRGLLTLSPLAAAVATASGLLCGAAGAQTAAVTAAVTAPATSPVAPADTAAPTANGQTVVVTGRGLTAPSVAGFGATALARSPLSASTLSTEQLTEAGVVNLGQLARLDASVGDAYNAEGYWAQLSVRGYTLDNRSNYRRDGLPIQAETAIALDNKARLEILRGASGIQAGVSAPGGLVNLVVKRPQDRLRQGSISLREGGSVLAAVDWSDRMGSSGEWGLRVNAAYEHLSPQTRDTQGQRSLLALAGDWRVASGHLLEVELESSRQTQPSVAGFSLLGDTVPAANSVDPRNNLNRQPWRQPVQMNGQTASLRWQTRLSPQWQFSAHAMAQRLHSNDRTAFPYGVFDADYNCSPCDRFGSDGRFSYWEYVSNHEKRNADTLDLRLSGELQTGAVAHSLQGGVLRSRQTGRFEDQIFDLAGPPLGHVNGLLDVAPSAGYTDANTNRSERSTEWSLRDVMRWGASNAADTHNAQSANNAQAPWSLWLGTRVTQLARQTARTSVDGDGSLRATDTRQTFTTPWVALAHHWGKHTTAYISAGQGMETATAPNRARYTNAGQAITLKSRQFEAGIKHQWGPVDSSLAVFDIQRPQAVSQGPCDSIDTCTLAIDGSARHRGLEARADWRSGAWHWQGSALLLDAQRVGSQTAAVNGLRPVNVPKASLRLGSRYRLPQANGLELSANLMAESDRMVLPNDNGLRIPGWSRIDLGARWQQTLGDGQRITWRAGIDNVFDRRAWKESPYQFDHAYLYPLAPRSWRLAADWAF